MLYHTCRLWAAVFCVSAFSGWRVQPKASFRQEKIACKIHKKAVVPLAKQHCKVFVLPEITVKGLLERLGGTGYLFGAQNPSCVALQRYVTLFQTAENFIAAVQLGYRPLQEK